MSTHSSTRERTCPFVLCLSLCLCPHKHAAQLQKTEKRGHARAFLQRLTPTNLGAQLQKQKQKQKNTGAYVHSSDDWRPRTWGRNCKKKEKKTRARTCILATIDGPRTCGGPAFRAMLCCMFSTACLGFSFIFYFLFFLPTNMRRYCYVVLHVLHRVSGV